MISRILGYWVSPGLSCHNHQSGPFQGSEGQSRETTQYQQGPIWATFGLLIFQNHYVAPFHLLDVHIKHSDLTWPQDFCIFSWKWFWRLLWLKKYTKQKHCCLTSACLIKVPFSNKRTLESKNPFYPLKWERHKSSFNTSREHFFINGNTMCRHEITTLIS